MNGLKGGLNISYADIIIVGFIADRFMLVCSKRNLFGNRAQLTSSLASAAAYYFAQRSANADHRARYNVDRTRKKMQQKTQNPRSLWTNDEPPRIDCSGSPSQESTSDPAATRHAPCTESQRVAEKSKYETSTLSTAMNRT